MKLQYCEDQNIEKCIGLFTRYRIRVSYELQPVSNKHMAGYQHELVDVKINWNPCIKATIERSVLLFLIKDMELSYFV